MTAGQQGNQRVNEFVMNINITRTQVEDNSAKKGAPKPPAKG